MGTKRFILFSLAACLLLAGCTCMTRHTEEQQIQTATAERPRMQTINPCAAPSMAKSMQAYPVGSGGNAIRLEKMAPEEIHSSEEFDYQIKVTNLTNRELNNVIVTEHIPSNLMLKSSSPMFEMNEQRAQWHFDSMGSRESTLITITAIAEGEGSIATCADVIYDSPLCAQMMIVEPQLELSKSAPKESLSCDRIPLKYVLTNNGSGYACNVEIMDQFPQGLITGKGLDHAKFMVDSLAPGESREFDLMVDATRTGLFSSKAQAQSDTGGLVHSNMTETRVTQPILALEKSGPEKQFLGRSLTYEIVLTNKGDGIARDTLLVAGVPEDVDFNTANAGGVFTRSSPGKITWKVGQLNPGESRKFVMTVSPLNKGIMEADLTAKAHCAETVKAMAETRIEGIPAILLEVVDMSDPIEVGKIQTYQVMVTNQGSSIGTNIRITCELEKNMEFISSEGPTQAMVSGKKIEFERLLTLAPREKAIWKLMVRASEEGNVRFKTSLISDQFERPVEETEATVFYR